MSTPIDPTKKAPEAGTSDELADEQLEGISGGADEAPADGAKRVAAERRAEQERKLQLLHKKL